MISWEAPHVYIAPCCPLGLTWPRKLNAKAARGSALHSIIISCSKLGDYIPSIYHSSAALHWQNSSPYSWLNTWSPCPCKNVIAPSFFFYLLFPPSLSFFPSGANSITASLPPSLLLLQFLHRRSSNLSWEGTRERERQEDGVSLNLFPAKKSPALLLDLHAGCVHDMEDSCALQTYFLPM